MSTKGRIRFSVSGVHPLLGFVRDHFIRNGYALVPWTEEADISLIGADIGEEEHPPLAQLELQKMHIGDTFVLLLSTYKARNPSTGAGIYAIAAEYLFGTGECLSIRPYNVYGSSITSGVIHDSILAARRQVSPIESPLCIASTFLYEDDFIKALDKLLLGRNTGVFDVGSPCSVSYDNAITSVWQFINKTSNIPKIVHKPISCPTGPNLLRLEGSLGWLPRTTLRSGLLKML